MVVYCDVDEKGPCLRDKMRETEREREGLSEGFRIAGEADKDSSSQTEDPRFKG